jgi:hypothetical protein
MTNPGRGDAQEEGFRGLGDIPPQEAESRACRGPRLGEAWVMLGEDLKKAPPGLGDIG